MKVRIFLLVAAVIIMAAQIQVGCSTKATSGSSAAQAMPPNGASNIPLTQELSWAPTTGATAYGVYFGNVNPPSFVITTTTNYYSSTTLDYSMSYFWRIDVQKSVSVTAGTVWNFRTISTNYSTPDQATTPYPTMAATNVGYNGNNPVFSLTWTPVGTATRYNVYLSTTYPPKNSVSSTTDPVYTPVGLLPTKTYYWRVDTVNSIGTCVGNLWIFTTGTSTTPVALPPGY